MQIRVAGKGAKERVLPMSPHLLHVLEEYWLAERKGRPGHGSPWLFLGEDQQSLAECARRVYWLQPPPLLCGQYPFSDKRFDQCVADFQLPGCLFQSHPIFSFPESAHAVGGTKL